MATNSNRPYSTQGMDIVSPKGKAMWAKFKEPDRAFDEGGVYSVDLVLDPSDPAVEAFIGRLEALQQSAFDETVENLGAKGKMVKKRPVVTDNGDGTVIFKTKVRDVDGRKAAGKRCEITVVDAQKQVLKDPPLVGNDSIIRVASFVYPYYSAVSKEVGVTALWNKMQIIDLVEFGSSGASDFDEEDGFVAGGEAGVPEVVAFEDDF